MTQLVILDLMLMKMILPHINKIYQNFFLIIEDKWNNMACPFIVLRILQMN